MARTDNLTNFLTDVANAIRTKKGTAETIQASNFDTEISTIETGGGTDINDYINNTPLSNASGSSSVVNKMIKKCPQINFTNLTNARYLFSYCELLTEVEGELDIGFSDNNTGIFGTAGAAAPTNLETIKIKNLNADIDAHYCVNLTKESILYLFNNAKTVTSGTITLGSTLLAKLTDDEIAIATGKGWTVN